MATVDSTASANSGYFKTLFRKDFVSSIVVFLVALPLCVGIAVAVGVNPARALITGIVGGLIVGIFSGSPLQVSGPAAGLFVIVADIITRQSDKFLATFTGSAEVAEARAMEFALAALGLSVLMAGLIQIAAGWLMLGRWFQAVSPAVINGMLAGIGVLIIVSQFHVMLDHQATWHGKDAHGGLEYAATIPEAIIKCFDADLNHDLAAGIGVITILTIVLWQSFAPQKLKLIPAALLGVILATIVAMVGNLELKKLNLPDNLLTETSFASLDWSGFSESPGAWLGSTIPSVASFTIGLLADPDIWVAAAVIGLIASAETLLCATAVDKMKSGHKTNYDKELMAQGVGNSICGILGALPMTGVIVRSSANVNAGGETRGATIMHGAWLLLFVALLPWVIAFVPKAALGALLVYTGFKLLNPKKVYDLWKTSRSEFAIYFATVALIVGFDLLVGVVTGIVLSAVKLLYKFTRLDADLKIDEESRKASLSLHGVATFIGLPKLSAILQEIPENAELHVDLSDLRYVDHACMELLMDWAKQHEKTGGVLVIDWNILHAKFKTEQNGRSNGKPSPEVKVAEEPNAT